MPYLSRWRRARSARSWRCERLWGRALPHDGGCPAAAAPFRTSSGSDGISRPVGAAVGCNGSAGMGNGPLGKRHPAGSGSAWPAESGSGKLPGAGSGPARESTRWPGAAGLRNQPGGRKRASSGIKPVAGSGPARRPLGKVAQRRKRAQFGKEPAPRTCGPTREHSDGSDPVQGGRSGAGEWPEGWNRSGSARLAVIRPGNSSGPALRFRRPALLCCNLVGVAGFEPTASTSRT
jgi:hypothetical protein